MCLGGVFLSSVTEKVHEVLERAGLSVPRRAAVALLVVLLSVGGLLAARYALQGEASSGEFEVHRATAGEGSSAQGSSVTTSTPEKVTEESATVFVHVVGAVMRPGVYALEEGARVHEAVQAAGGCLASAAPQGVNLAREVSDGEQIVVPTLDEWEAAGGAGGVTEGPGDAADTGGGRGGVAEVIDLNSAEAAELETLPGIGPATARKIVAERESGGPFTSVEDLMRVSGIGPKKIEAIREMVAVR